MQYGQTRFGSSRQTLTVGITEELEGQLPRQGRQLGAETVSLRADNVPDTRQSGILRRPMFN